jgi:AP-3 complex subunit delta-1
MYRVFQKYPDALHHGIGRLQEKLEDSDPGQPKLDEIKLPV